jgi:GDP-4-dehydro-6-deoxy-D-mannose reductase
MQPGKHGKPRILITGITGFVGSHMVDALCRQPGVELFGTKRWHHSSLDNLSHLHTMDIAPIEFKDCDLTDPIATSDMITDVRPDMIYHFAAESFVSPSWKHPSLYMRTNYDATVNLLDAVVKAKLTDTRILIPGSGEEYGQVEENELPITSHSELRPVNPYAVTKIAQDLIGYVYFVSYGLKVIRVRAFNHEGPRRKNVFGIPWYAYQIACIEHGLLAPVVLTGHVDDKRNFTHVVDMVQAYILAMKYCEPGKLYLIGSDDVHTFRDAVTGLISRTVSLDTIAHMVVPEYTRPTQVPRLIVDAAPFKALTGWNTTRTFEDILDDTLEYWRREISNGRHSRSSV